MNRIQLIVFRITDRCNLKCDYCYATAHSETRDMTFDECKRVLDYVKEFYQVPDKGLKIQFTGGEPLLAYELIEAIISYCLEIGLKSQFQIQTNGTLIDGEMAKGLKKNQISVGVSLDGIPERNDIHRYFHNNKGSSNDVISGIKHLAQNNILIGVTATVTKDNVYDLDRLVDMLSLFGNVKGLSFDLFRPMGRGEHKAFQASSDEIIQGVKKAIDRIDTLVQLGAPRIHIKEVEKIKKALSYQMERKIYCYALSGESFAVVPGGDIYPCSSFAGYEQYKLMNIYDNNKDFNNTISPFIKNFNLVQYNQCPTCDDKHICGGGCVARGIVSNNELSVNHTECALKKYYIEYVKGDKNEK